ncbi:glycoside hydrolase family 71/99-like protein [uncultured Tenacibaculum sp.]|uniref:glycoside hydrolase family 71/99-like protein n=1 Tax=uncultured Tenacibaculum sp. TaxID=174713 RepID=UPI002621C089|nr:glycoside hydrolase family 71/99-like protein [uncultured Tenacibaculum sp.]
MRFPPKNSIIILLCCVLFSCAKDYSEENIDNTSITKQKEEKFYKTWSLENEDLDLEKIVNEEEGIDLTLTPIIGDNLLQRKASKTGKKIYVHYMPWFQSKPVDGFWGQHWTMTNQNPDVVDANGKRQIASHYYPKIGPYSTNDKDLQQYHLLLMKLSGVDGVIFDWYGIRDVLDFELIKEGMDNIIPELEKTKMKFAVMYEDRVIREQARFLSDFQINQAKEDIKYIKRKYFKKRNYIKINGKKLLMVFGPNYINEPSDWEKILEPVKRQSKVLSLWNAREIIGNEVCSGEFAWIDRDHLQTLQGYYNFNANFTDEVIGGVAYPRFHDFYTEGGWRNITDDKWDLPGRGTDTFLESFYESENQNTDFIQIATWNDFGEGTMIEPTEELGFSHLEKLQEATSVRFKKEDLRIPYYIYKLKKQFPNERAVQFLSNRAYKYAIRGKLKRAKFLIGLLFYYYGDDFIS